MYSKLIRDIKDTINRENVPIELLVDLSAEYSEACEATNIRMNDVGQLLAQGYRGEAIALAEQSPKLLDVIDQLNFAQRVRFQMFLNDFGLDLGAPLVTDYREELEFAYQIQENLESLMNKHRLLALAKAPLSSRLKVLRNLADRDPGNPIWRDDVKQFERERLNELTKDARKAAADNDLDKLNQICREMDEVWTVPIPRSVREEINQSRDRIANSSAINQLKNLANQLNDCLLQMDVERGRHLRKQWQRQAQGIAIAADDPTYQGALEALKWLNEEDQRTQQEEQANHRLKVFKQTLATGGPVHLLERQLAEMQRAGDDIPTELLDRAQQQRQKKEEEHRNRSIRGAAITIAILALAALGAFLVWRSMKHADRISKAEAKLNGYNQELKFERAEDFYNTLPSSVRTDSRIAEAWERLKDSKDEDKARSREFARLKSTFQLDGPLNSDMDDLLAELESKGRGEELGDIAELRQKLKQERIQRQTDRTRSFQTELAEFQSEGEVISSKIFTTENAKELFDFQEKLKRWLGNYRGSQDGLPRIRPDVMDLAIQIETRVKSKSKEFTQSLGRMDALGRLDQVVGNEKEFAQALDQFAKDNPDDSYAYHFGIAAQESLFWVALKKWQTFANDPAFADSDLMTIQKSKDLVNQLDQLDPANPEFPFSKELIQLRKDLITNAVRPRTNIKQDLLKFLEQPAIRRLQTLMKTDSTRRYCKTMSDLRNSIIIEYYTDLNLGNTRQESIPKSQEVMRGLAGHCAIAAELKKQLETADLKDNQTYLSWIELVLNDKPDSAVTTVDPIPRGLILEEILRHTATLDNELGQFAKSHFDSIQAFKLSQVNWIGTDAGAKLIRQNLDIFTNRLKTQMTTRKADLMQADMANQTSGWRKAVDVEWIGWLRETPEGWSVSPISQFVDKEETVYALIPDTGRRKVEFTPIGESNGQRIIGITDPSVLVSGRPVYRRRSK